LSGIYIHIPFCRQACHYCNFHFATSLRYKDDMLRAIKHEIALRHTYFDYLPDQAAANRAKPLIETVYMGGGTPSLLNKDELLAIFDQLQHYFDIAPQAEITLEANPDDLTLDYLTQLRQTPINRLSIGIQSFFEGDLTLMNRAHNAQQAIQCVQYARDLGYDNLTIDLIYGMPTPDSDYNWQQNLAQIWALNIPHFSAYCLTVEPKTRLYQQINKGEVARQNEEQAAAQFEQLIAQSQAMGYWHYEISNFCLPNYYARHNTAYWQGSPYLGIGPSAHSFNGTARQWNIANNRQYIKAIEQQKLPLETETLSLKQQYNEYIMTSLRTMWGTDLQAVRTRFGSELQQYLLNGSKRYIANGLMLQSTQALLLSNKGKFVADGIISDLMAV
jgi:oxygen-independent coproporphyrinogen-3 oxidase